MPIAIGGTNGIFLQDDDGTRREFILRVVPAHGDNLIEVVVLDGDGVELGTPKRFSMTNSGHRITSDSPSVSGTYFILDGNHIAG